MSRYNATLGSAPSFWMAYVTPCDRTQARCPITPYFTRRRGVRGALAQCREYFCGSILQVTFEMLGAEGATRQKKKLFVSLIINNSTRAEAHVHVGA